MTRNHRNTLIICFTLGVVILMLVIPPWRYHFLYTGQGRVDKTTPGPYRLIFLGSPDIPITSRSNSKEYYNDLNRLYWRAEIDWARLILPIISIVILASGLLFFLNFYEARRQAGE